MLHLQGADGGEGLFACFSQVSLFIPPPPSQAAVTKWALGCSLVPLHLPILLSFALLCKPEAVASHSAAGGHQHCCRVAFPLQRCLLLPPCLAWCWLGMHFACCCDWCELCKPVRMPCVGRLQAVRLFGAERG